MQLKIRIFFLNKLIGEKDAARLLEVYKEAKSKKRIGKLWFTPNLLGYVQKYIMTVRVRVAGRVQNIIVTSTGEHEQYFKVHFNC